MNQSIKRLVGALLLIGTLGVSAVMAVTSSAGTTLATGHAYEMNRGPDRNG